MTDRRVPFALAVAVGAISFAAIFFRLAAPAEPLIAAAWRLTIAAVILLVPTVRAWRAGRLPRGVVRAALLGGLLYGVHFGTWVVSLTLTSVASSVTLVTATPLLLAIVALCQRRDRPTGRHWIAIALAVVGLAIIGAADASLSPAALAGDALALGGAAAMALYLLLVRRLGPSLDVLAFGGVTTAVGALSLFAAAAITGVPFAIESPSSALFIALAALIPQLVGHNLLTWSLRHATPTAVGIATVGEPVGATVLGWLWLGERPSVAVVAGCALTLAGVVVALRRASPEPG